MTSKYNENVKYWNAAAALCTLDLAQSSRPQSTRRPQSPHWVDSCEAKKIPDIEVVDIEHEAGLVQYIAHNYNNQKKNCESTMRGPLNNSRLYGQKNEVYVDKLVTCDHPSMCM